MISSADTTVMLVRHGASACALAVLSGYRARVVPMKRWLDYLFNRTSEIKARVTWCFLPTDEFPIAFFRRVLELNSKFGPDCTDALDACRKGDTGLGSVPGIP